MQNCLQSKLQEAVRFHQNDNLKAAERIYRRILRKHPDHADANHLLGVLLHQIGNSDMAVQYISKAIAENPNQALFYNNLGIVLGKVGKLEKALSAFDQALQLQPDFSGAYNNRGKVLLNLDKLESALAAFDKAIELNPKNAEAHNNRGVALKEMGKLGAASSSCEQALQIRPDYAEAYNNYGTILEIKGDLDKALFLLNRAIQLSPQYAEAYNNRGLVFMQKLKLKEALSDLDQALKIKPDYVDAHWNRSIILLLTGQFSEGWQEFQWRWKRKEFEPQKHKLPQPMWDGSPLDNKTLFLYPEQGYGDNIQFIRYVSIIHKSGGKIIVECDPPLKRLFASITDIDQLICRGDQIPDFDLLAPLMSLPYILNTTLETIPSIIPYLFSNVPAPIILINKERVKIGIVWAGNPKHKYDRNRSINIKYFSSLFDIKGTAFFSLQVGDPHFDILTLEPELQIEDLSHHLMDYSITASIIDQLDLIISVDTAVAHLAGALGKPVWTLIPFSPDWRWMLEREDTPWYPTMRLFRQPEMGDWRSMFQRLRHELEAFVELKNVDGV